MNSQKIDCPEGNTPPAHIAAIKAAKRLAVFIENDHALLQLVLINRGIEGHTMQLVAEEIEDRVPPENRIKNPVAVIRNAVGIVSRKYISTERLADIEKQNNKKHKRRIPTTQQQLKGRKAQGMRIWTDQEKRRLFKLADEYVHEGGRWPGRVDYNNLLIAFKDEFSWTPGVSQCRTRISEHRKAQS
jgi:hypothetical protein